MKKITNFLLKQKNEHRTITAFILSPIISILLFSITLGIYSFGFSALFQELVLMKIFVTALSLLSISFVILFFIGIPAYLFYKKNKLFDFKYSLILGILISICSYFYFNKSFIEEDKNIAILALIFIPNFAILLFWYITFYINKIKKIKLNKEKLVNQDLTKEVSHNIDNDKIINTENKELKNIIIERF